MENNRNIRCDKLFPPQNPKPDRGIIPPPQKPNNPPTQPPKREEKKVLLD